MAARNIARWDGRMWYAVGDNDWGRDDSINDIAIRANGDIFVGGQFSRAGGTKASSIARWDGSNWHALGRGIENETGQIGYLTDIAIDGNKLYTGGIFTLAGDVVSGSIAQWNMDDNTWSSITDGTEHGVTKGIKAMTVHNDDVYISSRELQSAGSKRINNIAKWDGHKWSAIADSVDGHIFTILVNDENDIYVGGTFVSSFLPSFRRRPLLKWDGLQWSELGGHFFGHTEALAAKEDTLYMTGRYQSPDNITPRHIVMWDGQNWDVLGGGLPIDFDWRAHPDSVAAHAIAVIDNDIYVGGKFIFVGDLQTAIPNLACWNGKEWDAVGGGRFNGTVKKMAVYRNELYVAGEFTKISRLTVNGIAKWDGHEWSGFGEDNPALQYHQALTVSRGRVFLAGNTFDNHNRHSKADVFMWNSGIWETLGDGVRGVLDEGHSNQDIHALGVHGNELFVGGEFYYAAANGREVLSANLAMWHLPKDPNSSMPVWSKLPAISFPEDSAATLALGQFTSDANYASTDLVFTADILNHSTGDASDLQINIDPSTHIAAFTTAENANGNFTVAFNATNPDQMTSSDTLQVVVRAVNDAPVIDGLPDEMILHPDEPAEIALWDYVADAETPDSLLQYDLSVSDDALTLNFNESTGTLMLQASNLNDVADVFITVRDDSNTAVRDTVQVKIETTTGVTSNENNIPAAFALLQNYPNPVVRGVQSSAGTATMFRFALPQAADVKLEVYTLAGQRVATVLNERRKSGFHQVGFQARNLSSGVYFYRLTAGNFRAMRKLLVVR